MFTMKSFLLFGLLSLVAPSLTARISRSAPNCKTVYDTTWQTVYHEYEVDKCTTRKEQVCHDFSYTQCSKVDKRSCQPIVKTTCGLDFSLQTATYIESNCSTTCREDCDFHWETNHQGDKVWVKDQNTCKFSEEELCVDEEKEKVWKEYSAKTNSEPDSLCATVGEVTCATVEDQFCTEVEVCHCEVEHKKVPIRVSTKQRKIVCDDDDEEVQEQAAGDISVLEV